MNRKVLTTFLIGTGIVGGLFFSTNQIKAEAINNGIVTTNKVTRLYDKNGKIIGNRALSANSPWITNKRLDLPEIGSAYQVATNEFVKAGDVQLKSDASIANTGVIKINYAPNSGADLWRGYGNNKIATGQKLANGTSWKFSQKIIDTNGDAWYEIGANQWVYGGYVQVTNKDFSMSAAKNWDPNFAVVQTKTNSTVFSDSNYSSKATKQLSEGTLVEVTSTVQTGDIIWYEISDGGWLPAPAVNTIQTSRQAIDLRGKSKDQVIDDVIAVAKQQLGKPYVWNAKGPDSYDCSGLMQYVFRQATGQNIGSWTVPQESAGTTVSMNQIQRGDLLFWGPKGASYHVALYLGNNEYLNALRPGTNVKIDHISASFEPSFGVRIFQ